MQIMTDRLVLREFRAEDWQAVHAYQNDPRYLRYYAWTERTPEAVRDFIQMFLDHQQSEPRLKFQLVIELKGSGQLIGNCGIRMEEAGAFEADIGYELDPRYWEHGYATEAARAIVRYGFTHFQLHRIWAWCIADNTGSAHVLEKVGMRLEGRMREKEFFKGRYWDTLLYAILEDEWRVLESGAEK